MSGGGTSSSVSQNNAQNNLRFHNTGSISVGGSIGNGDTTQGGTASSQGGGVSFSANVTLPTPTAPTAPTMPGLLLMNLSTTTNNHITENTHNIYHNTNNQTNIEKILNEWKLTQNGDRVSKNIYDFQNHANQGDETFGLLNLSTVDCDHLTKKGGVIDGSLFNFGDINNHQAGVLAFADTGKNLLCAGHVSNSGTAYFGML